MNELVNGGPPPLPAAPGKKKPKAGGRKVDADQAGRVRELYEQGVAAPSIEKQTGVKTATIYYRAKVGKWKRPKTSAATGEQMPGKVRCPSCELWTERNPCSNCGKKVRR